MMELQISKSIKLAANQGERKIIQVGDLLFGGDKIVVIAGPCSVESREQIMETARRVKESGASMLRGGVYKSRTSPYSFQGLGVEGLKLLAEAREETGLPIVTEVVSPGKVSVVEEYADVLQVGTRNAQNFPLLKRLGKAKKPVLLKRGFMSTIEEWLSSAEYILAGGNDNVILCERGIRTFQSLTRFTLDFAVVPIIKEVSSLPILVDPSHGTGVRSLVLPMSKTAVAAGADGLLIEVHPKPEEAKSDGNQSLRPGEFDELMKGLIPFARAVGRSL
jgi:3-deoxy-7-phosphoheptulonate synthase